ncbi:Dabb family protein [Magnetospirillum sp. UT-4]|uniref:Dabb family protein n=1 Tax=Magnetospirillum sp. UT-4 TaxID=2681467 RepID=UPI001385F4DE|nr:Dabb family protein [Magnetospirillum sp. UT-4]CAA7626298.1 hypothetical protein MTBUT4_750007 [Magnetospirillum sp. UT-4]
MLCDLRDMIEGARQGRFALPCFDVPDVALAAAAMEAAADMDSPVVLHPVRDAALLMPALQALARMTPIPTAMVLTNVADRGDAAEAIRLGVSGLAVANADRVHLEAMAQACAIALLEPPPARIVSHATPDPGFAWLGGELAESVSIPVARRQDETGRSLRWEEVIETAHKAARARAAAAIGRCGSAGWAEKLMAESRPRREVAHVVAYNADDDVHAMVAEGMAELSRIPGVRQVFAGQAVTKDSRYQHAWVIRFVGAGVIPYFRDHPAHVRFADERFRPMAADRMTIDFEDER